VLSGAASLSLGTPAVREDSLMRVTTNPVPITGDAEPWDPDNPRKFTELAGDAFLRREGDTAIVTGPDGIEDVIHPGWLVIRPDLRAVPHFTNAGNLGDGDGYFWNRCG
jgi:hypothetical protein